MSLLEFAQNSRIVEMPRLKARISRKEKEERVRIMVERAEKGLCLWTGQPMIEKQVVETVEQSETAKERFRKFLLAAK